MKLFFLVMAFSLQSHAFIPRASYVLDRLVSNYGKPPYEINLDVEIAAEPEALTFKETWIVIDQNNMSLKITGTKSLKGLVEGLINYRNGSRQSTLKAQSEAVFFEPFFHAKNVEDFVKLAAEYRLLPKNALAKKPYKNPKTNEVIFEPFVRFARLSGLSNYLYFDPSQPTGSAGFWIEQDSFLLKKIKIKDGLEMEISKSSQFARGITYPSERTVKWGQEVARLRTSSVVARAKEGFVSGQPTFKIDTQILSDQRQKIEEFYSKFR
jgi:hypothetical protein